ncbi:gamma-glutamyltransferase [Streptomyces sp. NPDC005921]
MSFTTRPTLQGTFGMVSSTHWLASQSAMAVLETGGNAYDAAVAGAFVLHVVEPHLNGPAGEVPILLAPAGGEVRVLCGQGVAPAGATVAHYRGLGLDLVPGTGPLAAAVPGPFDPVPPVAGARWVLPRLVGEVGYSTRTRAGLLRQPSWHRLRPDLAPEESAAELPGDLA